MLLSLNQTDIVCIHEEKIDLLYQYLAKCMFFRQGVAVDRLIGFQDLGGKDDFTTKALEALLMKKGKMCFYMSFLFLRTGKIFNCDLAGIIVEKKDEDDEDDVYNESTRRTVRSSVVADCDSD